MKSSQTPKKNKNKFTEQLFNNLVVFINLLILAIFYINIVFIIINVIDLISFFLPEQLWHMQKSVLFINLFILNMNKIVQ